MARRLKHWGWGYEDQAPSRTQLEEAAAGIRERLGFGGEVEEAVPLDEVEVRAPRLKAPAGSRGPLQRREVRAGLARARQVLRATSSAASGASSRTRPTWSPRPRDESEIEVVLSWCESEGAAVIPFGGGTSVVGGVEGAARRAAVRQPRPAPPRPGARGRPRVAGGADPGRGDGPAARGPAARARPDPAPLPAVLRVLDPRRLDRDPGRRPLRDPLHPHRRPGRVGAGDHPARNLGEQAAAGLGRGPLAGPGADRLRGDPRRRSPRPGSGSGRGRPSRPPAGSSSPTSSPRRGAVREISQSGLHPSNCRLLDALEAGTTGAGSGESNLLILGFESAHHPVEDPMEIAVEIAKRARR